MTSSRQRSGGDGRGYQARLRQLIDAAQHGQYAQQGATAPAHAPAPHAAPSLVDEIKRLADLHAAGALTDAEFAGFKSQLLAQHR
jgi:hypothetical protein